MPSVNWMNWMKKTFLYAVCVLLAVVFLIPGPATALEQSEGIDAMLLIDLSGSMRESDSSRVAIEATKMFIDMLETSNSRVGIIGFNDQLTGIVDITEINSEEDKARLKNIVENFNYVGWTDIGLSLREAVEVMSRNMRSTNSPMVLMLTDGKIELGETNLNGRKEEDSYNDVVEAVTTAGRKLPIYTIGLNYDGTVDRQLLRTISDNTGARSFIITEANDLPQIFNEIFADHIRSTLIEVSTITADGGFTDVYIDIDSDYVAVANIVMLSEHGIVDARLFDPSGNEAIFDQNTVSFSNSRKYSIIKMLFPEKGYWLLQVKGVSGDQIRVNLIYQYNISISIEVTQEEAIGRLFDSKSPILITGQILVNGEPVEDDSLYRATTSSVIVTDIDDNLLFNVPMIATPDGLIGNFSPNDDEPIVLYIETTASTFTKDSREVVLQFERITETDSNAPAPLPEEPEPDEPEQQLVMYIVAAVFIAALIGAAILLMRKRKPRFFEGFIEVRVMNERGVYTSVEAPALHTYVGTVDLVRFLTDNMPKKVREEIAALPFSVKNIMLSPAGSNNTKAILLENKSGSVTETENGTAIGKKHLWKLDEKITITSGQEDVMAKIELTYRVEE